MNAQIQVMVLFSLIGIGYGCKKLKIISNNMNNDISNLLICVSLPALIIVSFSNFKFSDTMLIEAVKLLIICLILNVFYIILSYIITGILQVKGTTRNIFQFGLVFTNAGFMGFPIAHAVFGEIGVFYMAIFNMLSDVFLWTFGIKVMSRPFKESMKPNKNNNHKYTFKELLNPCIIAVFIGIIIFLTSFNLPMSIHNSLELIGNINTPLSMIFIGSMLGDLKIKTIINDSKVILCSLVRLLVLPLFVLVILKLIKINGLLYSIPVIANALPVAVSTSIVAAKYKNDYYLASKLVFISTLFSIVTIPLFLWII